MRKILIMALCIAACIFTTLSFAACGKGNNGGNKHKHSFTVENVTDEYLCSEATCTEAAKYYYSCKCGEKGTATFAYGNALGHSFTNYVSDGNATHEKDGTKTATCDRCDATDTILDVGTKLPHTYDAKWTSDDEYHWHKATCEHVTEVSGKAKHTAGEWIIDEAATYEKAGKRHKECEVCERLLDTEEIPQLEKDEIIFKSLTANEDNTIYTKVPNSQEVFNFVDEIKVSGKAKYVVSLDAYGAQQIPTKKVPLTVGENTIYIIEIIGDNTTTYTVTIHRRAVYNVTFITYCDMTVSTQKVEEDSFANKPEDLEKLGYTFEGWDYDFTKAIVKNTTIKALWSANTDTTYKVVYYFEGNYQILGYKEEEYLQGTTDTTITIEPKKYEHFTFNKKENNVLTGRIAADGSLELRVYYNRNSYSVTVSCDTKKGKIDRTISDYYLYETKFTVEVTKTNAGYTFVGWYKNGKLASTNLKYIFSVQGKTHVVPVWRSNSGVPYKVKYYLQNIEDDKYTLKESYDFQGTTDGTVTAEIKTYTHFTFNEKKSKISGNIYGDGSLSLYVYYTRDQYDVSVNGDNLKAGTYTSINGKYKYNDEIKVSATTNAGYTFDGWFEGETLITTDLQYTFNVERDISLTAKWSTHVDTLYKINYYLQNLEDDEYTLQETLNLKGTTDTPANAEIKTYEHFTFNKDKSNASGNISGDGSLVLNLYYTRDVYSIKTEGKMFFVSGTYTEINGKYKYGKEFTINATTKSGYTFNGWFDGETLITSKAEHAFKVEKNLTLTAKWTANTDTPYKVEYYLQNLEDDGYSLYETNNLQGQTSDLIYAEQKEIEHFTFNAGNSDINGIISGDGSLVMKLYYTRDKYKIYVPYTKTEGGQCNLYNESCKYGTEITLKVWTDAGYAFDGWFEGNILVSSESPYTFIAEKTITLNVKWTPHTDTPYKVEYYLQNIDNDNYTLYETVNLEGTTNSTVNAEIKTYEHFTYYSSYSVTSGIIAGNGSLVLKVSYIRNQYTIKVSGENSSAGTCNEINSEYRFGKEIKLKAMTKDGYTFDGWYEKEILVSEENPYIITVEKDITLTAKWHANTNTPYRVEYYLINQKGEYELKESYDFQGTTDKYESAEVKDFNHYELDYNKSIKGGKIAGDGSTILKLYYKLKNYLLSNNDPEYGSITNNGSLMVYGDTYIHTFATEYLGCEFIGWYCKDELLSTEKDFTFTGEMSVTAKFKAKEEMSIFDFTTTTTTCIIKGINDNSVIRIIIPDYVTDVYSQTFEHCSNLRSVTIGKGIKNIGSNLFSNQNNLESVILSDGVESIGDYAFSNCSSIISIIIPSSVVSIGDSAFKKCKSLISVYWNATNCEKAGYYNYYIFEGCSSLSTVVISDYVQAIPKYAFSSCSIENAIIPAIACKDISNNELKEVTITSGDSIPNNAFSGCSKLTQINMPNTIISIGQAAFSGCVNLSEIVLPSSIKSIGDYAFKNSALTQIEIPNGVIDVGGYLFQQCTALTNITLHNNITKIPTYMFQGCSSLTSIVIPDSVTTVNSYAFSNCIRLTSIIIPDSVTTINAYAFSNCVGLLSVSIGENVMHFDSNAFNNCYKIIEIINKSSITIPQNTGSSFSFNGHNGGYKALNMKKNGSSDIIKQDDFLFYVFDNINYLVAYIGDDTEINLPYSFKGQNYVIYSHAFENCINVVKVKISSGVTKINKCAFYGCAKLTSVEIYNSITDIDQYTFYGCGKLDNIIFKGSIEQWKAINKSSDWCNNIPSTCIIHCNDGNLGITE